MATRQEIQNNINQLIGSTAKNSITPQTIGDILTDLNSGGGMESVTKLELDELITNNSLNVGTVYEISDVDPNLYGGTTVYLRALTSNRLEEQGYGVFYTPKYNQEIENLGIYDNYIKLNLTDEQYASNFWINDKTATADNGATAYFLQPRMLMYISGDWSTATSYVVSGMTFNISSVNKLPTTYAVNDRTIYGGKYWRNKNGNIGMVNFIESNWGDIIDLQNLNDEWEIIPYNENDYNINFDIIKFDYYNNIIIYRKDNCDNEVTQSKSDLNTLIDNWYDSWNSIKDFQWGRTIPENRWDYGVFNNKISTASILRNINSSINVTNNILTNESYIIDNYIFNETNYNSIDNNILDNWAYIENNIIRSVYNNTFYNNSGVFSNRCYDNSFISKNILTTRSQIGANVMNNNSYISDNDLSIYGTIINNILDNSTIEQNVLKTYSTISNGLLTNGRFNYNTFSNGGSISLGFNNTLEEYRCEYLTFNGGQITENDLQPTTTLFTFGWGGSINHERTVFKNSAGVTKVRYYNENDVLVIADITD